MLTVILVCLPLSVAIVRTYLAPILPPIVPSFHHKMIWSLIYAKTLQHGNEFWHVVTRKALCIKAVLARVSADKVMCKFVRDRHVPVGVAFAACVLVLEIVQCVKEPKIEMKCSVAVECD